MSNITVGHLKELLSAFNDDMELDFNGLEFYRLKQRAPNLVQVEFNQLVYKEPDGKIKVDSFE